uniref:Uncharacterized protein n=1 Tax=Arsenophonus nasoniae TaxID=638 RepID=D2TXI7_9GAMM|nr:hypothetical protein ARN_08090 [Arsenophonus nasoniae]
MKPEICIKEKFRQDKISLILLEKNYFHRIKNNYFYQFYKLIKKSDILFLLAQL